MSRPAPATDEFVLSDENELLYPLSHLGSKSWADKSVEEIREALGQKPKIHYPRTESEEVRKVKETTAEAAV